MTNLPNIPIGILPGDNRVEFFAHDFDVLCFHNGKTWSYNEFPDYICLAVIAHMAENPHLVKEVQENTLMDFGGDFSKRYTYYIFGGLNLTPDIDLDGTMNGCDFFNCDEDVPMILSINNSNPLTKRQIDIMRNVTLPNKHIADRLHISILTVETHMQNIRVHTGLFDKSEMTAVAVKEGMI